MSHLYDMGPVYQWRFARQADREWVDACFDSQWNKTVQGFDSSRQISADDLINHTEFFIWMFNDYFPHESIDVGFYERKHAGEAHIIRQHRYQYKWVTLIIHDRSIGQDVMWVSEDFFRINGVSATQFNINFQKHSGEWWQRQSAIGVHPDHRGNKHHILVGPFHRGLMSRGHFPAFNVGGWIRHEDTTVHVTHKQPDSDPYPWDKRVYNGKKMSSVDWWKEKLKEDDPSESMFSIPNQLNEQQNNLFAPNVGYKWIAIRKRTEAEFAALYNDPNGAIFTWGADFMTEVGYNEDGKLCFLPDPTKSLKPYFSMRSSDTEWIDSTFV